MKKIITIFFLLSLVINSFAQITVKGTVKDSNGEPVVGAVITAEDDTRTGTVTDSDGKYSITLSAGTKNVQVSCMSYKTQLLPIAKSSVLNIVLEDDLEMIDDVVVIGYGSMRRGDLTGAVTSVKIDDDLASKSTTLDQMLEGRAAGVQVLSDSGNPDAGVNIQIRGVSTFSGNSDPLYVVDGVIINGQTEIIETISADIDKSGATDNQTSNALAGINPQDISSIEILKDASATAIYGSQGANGVVLITTKQALKDKPVVNFNAGVSIGTPTKKLNLQSFDEFVLRVKRSGRDISAYYEDTENLEGLKVTPIDWQDYVMRTSVSQRYYFSVSGRPNRYNYFLSLGYSNNQGVLKNTDSKAFTGRINLSADVAKFLKLSFRSTFGYTFSNLVSGRASSGTVTSNSSLLSSVQRTRPYIYQSPDEDEIDDDLTDNDEYARWGPDRYLKNITNNTRRFRVTPALTADFYITKWLSFRSTFGVDYTLNESNKSKNIVMTLGLGNTAGFGYHRSMRWNWDNMLTANKKWGDHSLTATLGQSASKVKNSYQSISGKGLPQRYAMGLDISYTTSEESYISLFAEPQNQLMSFFGRAVYNYSDRYILTGTLRFDGSSRFQRSNKWGVFPSAAFAWRIANEPWFNVRNISSAKLRVGWGQVGNQNLGNYLTTPIFETSLVANHYNAAYKDVAVVLSNLVNPNLKWETTTQWNIGIDLGLLDGRISMVLDAYDKLTTDLLQTKKVAYSTGYTDMSVNDGVVNNRGIEFTLETVPVKTRNLEFVFGGNISFNSNRIMNVGKMGDSTRIFLSPDDPEPTYVNYFNGDVIMSAYCGTPVNVFMEGMPMGVFVGYKFDGIVQEGETNPIVSPSAPADPTGCCKFRDLNGDGELTIDDRCVLGDPNPDFTYGLNMRLSYKRLELSVAANGSYGNDIANFNKIISYWTSYTHNCYREAADNAWTPENKSNTFPKLEAPIDNGYFSDRFIEDGSYFRISNLSLSYAFPFTKKTKFIHGLSLTASVGNVYIFTKYDGYAPCISMSGTNIKRVGVDLNTAPFPRTYNFDIKFTF